MDERNRKGGLLYPMLVIAAIAVITFSMTGIATMMGWLPNALSGRDPAPGFEQAVPRGEMNDRAPSQAAPRVVSEAPRTRPAPAVCANCGVIDDGRRTGVAVPAGRLEGSPAQRDPR